MMQFNIRKVGFDFFEKNLLNCYLADFPEDERYPVDELKVRHLEDKIEILCLFKDELLCGYAILLLDVTKENCIIWNFAICEEYRNMGVGTEFLKLLKDELTCYKNVIIEVERRNCGVDIHENAIRDKRFNFYKNLDLNLSELKVCVFGVEYEIFLFDECKESVDELFELYKEIYYNVRNKEIIDKKIVKVL